MMTRILIITMIAAVTAVSQGGTSENNVSLTKPIPWNRAEIADHSFELVSKNQIEVFTFTTNDTVIATIGTQEALAGPVLSWGLTSNGVLVVKDDSIKVVLQKVASGINAVQVLRNGLPETYKVTETK